MASEVRNYPIFIPSDGGSGYGLTFDADGWLLGRPDINGFRRDIKASRTSFATRWVRETKRELLGYATHAE